MRIVGHHFFGAAVSYSTIVFVVMLSALRQLPPTLPHPENLYTARVHSDGKQLTATRVNTRNRGPRLASTEQLGLGLRIWGFGAPMSDGSRGMAESSGRSGDDGGSIG